MDLSTEAADCVRIGRVRIDRISFSDAVQQILSITAKPYGGAKQIVTVNAQFVTLSEREERMAGIIEDSALSVADGVPLLWVARLLGTPLRGRVNGTELMVSLCEQAALHGRSVYFLGGMHGTAELTAQRMKAKFPKLIVAGVDCPSMNFEQTPAIANEVAERIDSIQPDILFVAFGAPRAEYWIRDHVSLHAKVMIGVGGSFEIVGGIRRRAPRLFQRAGAEWLWRLCIEPRRLGKRYVLGNAHFLLIALRKYFRRDNAG